MVSVTSILCLSGTGFAAMMMMMMLVVVVVVVTIMITIITINNIIPTEQTPDGPAGSFQAQL